VSVTTGQWWVDGALREVDPERLGGWAIAPEPASSSYTTARVHDGEARWHGRHVARLRRDAGLLGLGEIAASEVALIFRETGRANFGDGEGIVRLQIQRGSGANRLIGIPRPLGPEPESWTAMTAQFPHDGPSEALGAKLAGRALFGKAHEASDAAGVDEALLLDSEGYLIEGARSNLFLVSKGGTLCVPDLARGGVAGVAREILCELAAPQVRNIHASEIAAASELVATNAVRGACPIVVLDQQPVGEGRPGAVAARLAALLAGASAPPR